MIEEGIEESDLEASRDADTALEATDDVDTAGPARRQLAETRRDLLRIRYEFAAMYASSDEHAGHEIPPIIARGGSVETIVGPDPIAFERHHRNESDDS